MLCMYAMQALNMKNKTRMNICHVVCVRYADLEDEEQDQNDNLLCCVCVRYEYLEDEEQDQNDNLLCCVCTLYRS